MNNAEKLKNDMEVIKSLKEKVLKSLSNAPQGMIRCEMAHGKYPQYYLLSNDEKERDKYPRGKFLHKEDMDLVKACVQKEYDIKMLSQIEKLEKKLAKSIECTNIWELQNVYNKMPLAKRNLIKSHLLSDEEYVQNWKNNLSQKNSYPIENGQITENKELVRSKSEKIIADKLYSRGIPYLYESKLYLRKGKVMCPDFTLLNVRTRETFYYEHFGMMDNPEYCKSALTKLEGYAENGIYLGEKLLVTFESSMKALQMKEVDSIIERFLL